MIRKSMHASIQSSTPDVTIKAGYVYPEESEAVKRYRTAEAEWEKAQSNWFDHAMHLYKGHPARMPHDGCTCGEDLENAFFELRAARDVFISPTPDTTGSDR